MAVCFLVGFSRWVTYRIEIYPIAAWSMFQRVKKDYREYDLRVHRIGGREVDPPASAHDEEERAGVALDGHRLLVLNGYVKFQSLGDAAEAERYQHFIDRHIVGPDARYEILELHRRSRPSERHLERIVAYGPFSTVADTVASEPATRFAFDDGKPRKFRDRQAFGRSGRQHAGRRGKVLTAKPKRKWKSRKSPR